MMKIKSILPTCFFAILVLLGCNKDDSPPLITGLSVDGTTTTAATGGHTIGTTVVFQASAIDDSDLAIYEVIEEGAATPLLATGNLEGTSGTFSYSFLVDEAKYSVGDSINLTFLVEDGRGLSGVRGYKFGVKN